MGRDKRSPIEARMFLFVCYLHDIRILRHINVKVIPDLTDLIGVLMWRRNVEAMTVPKILGLSFSNDTLYE